MKRLLSLVLVAAFVLPLVIGCGEEAKKASAPAPGKAEPGKGGDAGKK